MSFMAYRYRQVNPWIIHFHYFAQLNNSFGLRVCHCIVLLPSPAQRVGASRGGLLAAKAEGVSRKSWEAK